MAFKHYLLRHCADSIQDIAEHGADAGYAGLTFYAETVPAWHKYKKEIMAMANSMAADLGTDVISMVRSFRCVGNDYTPEEIGKTLYGNNNNNWRNCDAYTHIANAMVWFAAEEIAREMHP